MAENNYPNAITAALAGIANGAEQVTEVAQSGAGRPHGKRLVNGVVLDRVDYGVYLALVEFWKLARELVKSDIMTDEQFVAFMKEAAPKINQRMINMALVSDDLKSVRAVASDLADRGFGKSAQQLNINVGMKDIRSAWKELEGRKLIDMGVVSEVMADSELAEDESEMVE